MYSIKPPKWISGDRVLDYIAVMRERETKHAAIRKSRSVSVNLMVSWLRSGSQTRDRAVCAAEAPRVHTKVIKLDRERNEIFYFCIYLFIYLKLRDSISKKTNMKSKKNIHVIIIMAKFCSSILDMNSSFFIYILINR